MARAIANNRRVVHASSIIGIEGWTLVDTFGCCSFIPSSPSAAFAGLPASYHVFKKFVLRRLGYSYAQSR